ASLTVRWTRNAPFFRYRCGAANVVWPGAWMSFSGAEPSPQSTTKVWASRPPGSATEPLTVVRPCLTTWMDGDERVRPGATLLTTTGRVRLFDPPLSSRQVKRTL